MYTVILFLLLSQVPVGYYDDAEGKIGAPLRNALHDIIDDHTVIPHNSSGYDTHDALDDVDEDPMNPLNVILIYSGYSVPKSTWPDWNREHSWPKSLGTENGPAHTDVFHLYACDMNVNSSRGNKYYDDGGTSSHPEAPECKYDADSWEVRDEDKGDVARAMFYLDVRYNGDKADELDLELTSNTSLILSGSRYMGKLSTLLKWHALDPVDDKERTRNDFIYNNIQHNRNPFVDNPSWVYSVWGGALVCDAFTIPAGTGCSANFTLDAGAANSGRQYFLLSGVTGTEPGTPLPGGYAVLPMNWDVFTDLMLSLLNTPVFSGFAGKLGTQGTAAAQLNAPPVTPAAAGIRLYFAYALSGPFDFTSNPVECEIVP